MIITGIEVIRGNPGGGIRHNPGVAIGVVAGEKIELNYGLTLRVNVSFDYRGSARAVTLHGAIGNHHVFPTDWFDDICQGEADIPLPASPTEFTPCTASVDVLVTSALDPATYDLRVKFPDYLEAGQPTIDDVIDIVGIPPTYELLEETIYPYAYVYDGDVEVSTFTFKTDPLTPADWIVGKLAAAVKDQVEQDGGRVMEMRVYVDKTPLLWADWRIEVVGVPPMIEGVATGIAWWAVAILAALAIALIIVITWSIKTIVSSFTHKALSPEIKATWSRETLISCIGDFEAKLERTPTPAEELEGMSDQELRDYCDQLAEEIVPPEVSWLPFAILGGVGLLGIAGAAMAFGMAKPGE